MKMLKTLKASGVIGYMPYKQSNIETIQSVNKFGNENNKEQKMSVWAVEVPDYGGEEKVLETIFLLDIHKSVAIDKTKNIDKEIELAEKELALQQKETRLADLEAKLKKKQAKLEVV